MWMRRVAWCLRFDSEKRGGKTQGFWNEPNAKGRLRDKRAPLGPPKISWAHKKGNSWGGLTFYTKPPLYTRRGAIIRLFAPVRGAITWEKGQKQCSAPGPLPQDWLLTWVDRRGADMLGLMRFCLLGFTKISWHSSLTDLCFHQLRSLHEGWSAGWVELCYVVMAYYILI